MERLYFYKILILLTDLLIPGIGFEPTTFRLWGCSGALKNFLIFNLPLSVLISIKIRTYFSVQTPGNKWIIVRYKISIITSGLSTVASVKSVFPTYKFIIFIIRSIVDARRTSAWAHPLLKLPTRFSFDRKVVDFETVSGISNEGTTWSSSKTFCYPVVVV